MLFLKHKSNECLSNTTGCIGVSRLGRRANQACIEMKLRFSKMQGAGNDFVVLDGVRQRIELSVAHRRFGIGADQVLVVERPNTADADFRYRIFNADGIEVEQCGNGARCIAKFANALGLTRKRKIAVEVQTGLILLQVRGNGEVAVDMGQPVFEPARAPFNMAGLQSRPAGADTLWPLQLNGRKVWVSIVSMGNPHAVQTVDEVDCAPVSADGAALEAHPRFAKRVNAGFMQIISRSELKLRVYERGAGETLACGSGACAAAVIAIRRGLADSPVTVRMRGGALRVAWIGAHVQLSGPA